MRCESDLPMWRLTVGIRIWYQQGVEVVCISVSSLIPIRIVEFNIDSCPGPAHLLEFH